MSTKNFPCAVFSSKSPPARSAVALRFRSANPFFRSSSLLSMPVSLAMLGNGHAPCRVAVLVGPLHAALLCGGGSLLQAHHGARLRRSRCILNTILQQSLCGSALYTRQKNAYSSIIIECARVGSAGFPLGGKPPGGAMVSTGMWKPGLQVEAPLAS